MINNENDVLRQLRLMCRRAESKRVPIKLESKLLMLVNKNDKSSYGGTKVSLVDHLRFSRPNITILTSSIATIATSTKRWYINN